jgi:hypothetical protein
MREVSTVVTFSVVLTLIFYGLLFPFLPGDAAAQIASGVMATGPVLAEYLKKRRVSNRLRANPKSVVMAAGLSWYAAAAYGVLLAVGIPNIAGGTAGFFEFLMLRGIGVTDPIILAQAAATACIVPVTASYFFMGRIFVRCDRLRWLAVAITIIFGPLLLRLIDFLLIPQSFFEASFPLAERSLPWFLQSLAWTMGFLAIFLPAGTIWYGRRHYRLRVSAMMRLLPIATQQAIAELVRDEVERGRLGRAVP